MGCQSQPQYVGVCENHPQYEGVFNPRQSRLRYEGSPWGGVRKPLRGTIIGPQAYMSGVLLAYNAEGCQILYEDMWQVPMLQ